jgi:RNA polymerase sigma factor (sigma-70 family)
MVPGQSATMLRQLNRLLVTRSAQEQTDAQLLRRFAARREEAAFAALLARHGRLVWEVCRRTLGHEHDAEDAFQAAFLVLARKAGSVRKGESVGSFLYGVAYRVAMKAKHTAAARRAREQRAAIPVTRAGPDAGLRELQTILTEEVNRLSASHRAAFVLCCLEGKSTREAAEELGVKEGTFASRLARARQRLQERLTRRGVVLAAALTTAAVAAGTASATVPPLLLEATLNAAAGSASGETTGMVSAPVAALTKGVIQAMFLSKLKYTLFVLTALAVIVAGTTVIAQGPVLTILQPAPSKEPSDDFQFVRSSRQRLSLFNRSAPAEGLAAGKPASWKVSETFPGEPNEFFIDGLAFSPDGKTFVINGRARVTLWNVGTKKQLAVIDNNLRPPVFVGYTTDGTPWLFRPEGVQMVGEKPRNYELFNLATGKTRATFKDLGTNAPFMKGVSLSPSGDILATVDQRRVILWDAKTGEELLSLPGLHHGSIVFLRFSPNGKTLASVSENAAGDGREIKLWDVAKRKEKVVLKAPLGSKGNDLAFSPDGKMLAVWVEDHGKEKHGVLLMNTAEGTEQRYIQAPKPEESERAFAFASDSKTLAIIWTARKNEGYVESGRVVHYDAATGVKIAEGPSDAGRLIAVTFSPEGKLLATGNEDGTVRWWVPSDK